MNENEGIAKNGCRSHTVFVVAKKKAPVADTKGAFSELLD